MSKQKRTHQRQSKLQSSGGGSQAHEWVGGRIPAPMYVTEGEPYRPEMILWLELPGELIVGSELVNSQSLVLVRDSLLRTMKQPAVGKPRRPSRIRVADEALATVLRTAVPDIEIVVAKTPELEVLSQALAEFLPEGDEVESYFEEGRVSKSTVQNLFEAAARLYPHAPWNIATELRLDIPDLGVAGACVSIIGELGESRAVLIFPSLTKFEAFLSAAEASHGKPSDLGTSILGLNFESAADLPASMRREAAAHGWPVVDVHGYPRVEHRDRDGLLRPLQERDVRIVTACANALSKFLVLHRKRLTKEPPRPVAETFTEETGLNVRITAPYEEYPVEYGAGPSQHSSVPVRVEPKVLRNALCPCGSGKKHKKCCLPKDEAQHHEENRPASVHTLDERLVHDLIQYARNRFGEAWICAADDFEEFQSAAQLFYPWSVYGFRIDGRTVAEWYVVERGGYLSAEIRNWLEAQRQSWLTLWEVLAVEPGRSLTLKDLLSGEERTVHESRGSQTLVRRDVLMGRVVDHEGLSIICGMYPRSLPPLAAAQVVQRIRRKLRRRTDIPVERLRDEELGRYMIARFEEAIFELDEERLVPPRLTNTDGEELLFTTDHFAFDPGQHKQIESALRALPEVQPSQERGDETFTFLHAGNRMHKSWDNTVVGRAVLSNGALKLETNSIGRADALRQRVEAACGGLIRHRMREHSDPIAQMSKPGAESPSAEPPELPQSAELLREWKSSHYADWLDTPLPALDGKTPRQVARTKAGRKRVDTLLKHMENQENRRPAGTQQDFSGLRTELELDGRG